MVIVVVVVVVVVVVWWWCGGGGGSGHVTGHLHLEQREVGGRVRLARHERVDLHWQGCGEMSIQQTLGFGSVCRLSIESRDRPSRTP